LPPAPPLGPEAPDPIFSVPGWQLPRVRQPKSGFCENSAEQLCRAALAIVAVRRRLFRHFFSIRKYRWPGLKYRVRTLVTAESVDQNHRQADRQAEQRNPANDNNIPRCRRQRRRGSRVYVEFPAKYIQACIKSICYTRNPADVFNEHGAERTSDNKHKHPAVGRHMRRHPLSPRDQRICHEADTIRRRVKERDLAAPRDRLAS
jgi:hypothetical protein